MYARQLDISTAFVNALIKRRVVVSLPPHWERPGRRVALLLRALYGLKTSPRDWYDAFKDALVNQLKYNICDSEPTLFQKSVKRKQVLVCIYVGDVICFCKDEKLAEQAREEILNVFKGTREDPWLIENDGTENRKIL